MKKYIVLLFLAFSCMNALHARKGFDREIKQTLFVPKGTWMGGVSFSYMELTGDDYKFLVLDDMGGEGYTFKVSPYVGYFIKDNIAVGARFNYNRTYADIGNIDIDLGDDLNFNISDYKYLEHQYTASGFLRTYMGLGNSKIFGFFNEVRLTYGYGQGKTLSGTGNDQTGDSDNSGTSTGDAVSPQTGDSSNVVLWVSLLFASGAGLLGATVYRRKKKYNQ